MMRSRKSSRGYSMAKILVVEMIVGLIVGVGLPALTQLFPQYQIRSASSQLANAARTARQKAVSTRRPHRISLDLANNRYAAYAYAGPLPVTSAAISNSANWRPVDSLWQPVAPSQVTWIGLGADLRTYTAQPFADINSPADGLPDIVFNRDRSVYTSGIASMTPPPGVLLAVDSTWVTYNRYRVNATTMGRVDVLAYKV